MTGSNTGANGVVRIADGSPGPAEGLAVGCGEQDERLGVVLDLPAAAGPGPAGRR